MWVKFDVAGDRTYRIVGEVPDESSADLELAVYNSCDSDALISQTPTFSGTEILLETASTGMYYARFRNEASSFGDNVTYTISVHVEGEQNVTPPLAETTIYLPICSYDG